MANSSPTSLWILTDVIQLYRASEVCQGQFVIMFVFTLMTIWTRMIRHNFDTIDERGSWSMCMYRTWNRCLGCPRGMGEPSRIIILPEFNVPAEKQSHCL